jgi:TRAP-type C4-dicarboxylate transport system substrate-binding protein
MRKRNIGMILCFVVLAFVLSVYAVSSPAMAQEKTFTLKVTNFLPPGHQASLAFDQWGKDLEKATNNRVKVKIYHSATLAAAVQQYDAVVKGIADVGNHVLGYTMNRFPLSEVLDLPLGIPNASVAAKMMNEYYKKMKPKEFNDVKVLWFHGQGPGYVCTRNKQVQKMEDLKGMKMRCYGGNARFLQALGGTPVAMPMTEVYDALSRGMVDGLLSSLETLESFRTGEHVQYVTQNKLTAYGATFLVAMNKKTWNSLPPDIQTIIDQSSQEQIDKFGKAWDQGDTVGKTFLEKRGVKFLTLPREEEQHWIDNGAKPLYDDYVKRMKERNLPGNEALKVVLDFLKPYKK